MAFMFFLTLKQQKVEEGGDAFSDVTNAVSVGNTHKVHGMYSVKTSGAGRDGLTLK